MLIPKPSGNQLTVFHVFTFSQFQMTSFRIGPGICPDMSTVICTQSEMDVCISQEIRVFCLNNNGKRIVSAFLFNSSDKPGSTDPEVGSPRNSPA